MIFMNSDMYRSWIVSVEKNILIQINAGILEQYIINNTSDK